MSGEKQHASTKLYWVFAVVLCLITYLEWEITHWLPGHSSRPGQLSESVVFWGLIVMSLTKFTMVVGWYMHLRYDHNWVRKTFYVPLIMATATGLVLGALMFAHH